MEIFVTLELWQQKVTDYRSILRSIHSRRNIVDVLEKERAEDPLPRHTTPGDDFRWNEGLICQSLPRSRGLQSGPVPTLRIEKRQFQPFTWPFTWKITLWSMSELSSYFERSFFLHWIHPKHGHRGQSQARGYSKYRYTCIIYENNDTYFTRIWFTNLTKTSRI